MEVHWPATDESKLLPLPQGYLSYSQASLWLQSKNQYRTKYFMKGGSVRSAAMDFGKMIAEKLESGDEEPLLAKVPRYEVPEYEIRAQVEDVRMLAFVDTFSPDRNRFREYKTGQKKKDGSDRWDGMAVMETLQLPFYSFLIEHTLGSVTDACHLDWMETHYVEKTEAVSFDGHELEQKKKVIELTGYVRSFERVITKEDRARTRSLFLSVAREISAEWLAHLEANPPAAEAFPGEATRL